MSSPSTTYSIRWEGEADESLASAGAKEFEPSAMKADEEEVGARAGGAPASSTRPCTARRTRSGRCGEELV